MEHVTLDQIQTAMIGKTIKKHMGKYLGSEKAAKALRNVGLRNNSLLALIASYVKEKKLDTISSQREVETLENTAMANRSNRADPALAAGANQRRLVRVRKGL